MSQEGQLLDKKSLRAVLGKTAKGIVRFDGDKRWRRYWAIQP